MRNDIKEALASLGLEFTKPACSMMQRTTEQHRLLFPSDERVKAVPVAEVANNQGKSGVIYFWNTGEFALLWNTCDDMIA